MVSICLRWIAGKFLELRSESVSCMVWFFFLSFNSLNSNKIKCFLGLVDLEVDAE